MPPEDAARIDSRLDVIEGQLGELVKESRLLVEAIAGPRDGSRPGFAEKIRDHDARIEALEARASADGQPIGIFQGRPGLSIRREVATHAGAGGVAAFLVLLAQMVLEKVF